MATGHYDWGAPAGCSPWSVTTCNHQAMTTSVEVWKSVVGYEGLYEVSDQGRVKGPKGFVKPKIGRNCYARTELWRKGDRHRPSIHRLVAQTFIPNPDGKPQVNHLDGDKLNNTVANLEWCTAQENALHAVALHGRHGERATAAKLSERKATAILVMLEKGAPGKWLADLFGVTNAQISHLRLNRQWRALKRSPNDGAGRQIGAQDE